MKVYEATVSAATGGFGMYQRGELSRVEGANDIADWLSQCAELDVYPVADDSLDGKIYDQNGGQIFRVNSDGAEDEQSHYVLVYCTD